MLRAQPDGKLVVEGSLPSYEDKLLISRTLRRLQGCVCVINKTVVPTLQRDGRIYAQIGADGQHLVLVSGTDNALVAAPQPASAATPAQAVKPPRTASSLDAGAAVGTNRAAPSGAAHPAVEPATLPASPYAMPREQAPTPWNAPEVISSDRSHEPGTFTLTPGASGASKSTESVPFQPWTADEMKQVPTKPTLTIAPMPVISSSEKPAAPAAPKSTATSEKKERQNGLRSAHVAAGRVAEVSRRASADNQVACSAGPVHVEAFGLCTGQADRAGLNRSAVAGRNDRNHHASGRRAHAGRHR